MNHFKLLPYHWEHDLEAQSSHSGNIGGYVEGLKRWKKVALVLNASRRFRYSLDLKKEKEKKQIVRMITANAQAIRAAEIFKEAGKCENVIGSPTSPSTPNGDYSIGKEQLALVTRDHDLSALLQYGGVKGLADLLKTNLEKGIHGDDANLLKRKNVFGSNTYPRKKKSFLRILWVAWQDSTLIILMIAAATSLALDIWTKGIKEGWEEGGSLAFVVLLVIAVKAGCDYGQSLEFQNLNKEQRNIHLKVIRGGRTVEVSLFDIVVGDVVPLNIGDQVPADGILISGHSLAIDESSMTGESKIVRKDSNAPFLMYGCKLADGSGTMLVTSVGINTEWGLLMASISEDTSEETPLQVTSVVVVVPEGLPFAVVLTLAYSMRKMMADKALVRRLSACETMGSATIICCDKTGTLTLNLMTVVAAYVGGKKIDPLYSSSLLPPMLSSLLIEGISQNTNGSVFTPAGGGEVKVSGSPTERAILYWGVKLGMNFESVRSNSSIMQIFLFNSEEKRGGVALQLPDSQVHVHWKGAAEIVLASCTGYIDANDHVVPMDEDKVTLFKKAIEDMAAGSLRCVAIAYRSYEMENVPIDEEQLAQWALPKDDLVLLAIVGLEDPCQPGVKDAVRLCQNAGVKVCMVTGDILQTAKPIALECGILNSEEDATEPNLIEGNAFRALSDVQREEVAGKISVMGSSSPNDKLLFVQALRNRGHIVAVTGDGTNDVPALHEADIGLAMGIQGTEVAKESSDIIILDDSFASVVKVVRWSRLVYANIQKFIQFQLTVNVAAIIINAVAATSSGYVPLNTVQLLWVRLIIDTLGALALATEQPTDHLMHKPPVGRRESLITNIMWRNSLIQALYQVIVLLVLNSRGRSLLCLEHDTNNQHKELLKNTIIYNAFVLCQIFNIFNSRKPDDINVFKGITRHRLFMGIVGLTLVLHTIINAFLGKSMSMVRLNWKLWLVPIVIGFISWPLAAIGKLIPVPETSFSKFIEDFIAKSIPCW